MIPFATEQLNGTDNESHCLRLLQFFRALSSFTSEFIESNLVSDLSNYQDYQVVRVRLNRAPLRVGRVGNIEKVAWLAETMLLDRVSIDDYLRSKEAKSKEATDRAYMETSPHTCIEDTTWPSSVNHDLTDIPNTSTGLRGSLRKKKSDGFDVLTFSRAVFSVSYF